jgi:hypothetical protein
MENKKRGNYAPHTHTPKDRDLLTQKEIVFKAFYKRVGTIAMISKRSKVSTDIVMTCVDEWTKRKCIAIVIDARCEVTNRVEYYYTTDPYLVKRHLKTWNDGE